MKILYEEIKTIEIFNYHVLVFEKKWTEAFRDPMKFKVMLDKTGLENFHLVSTKSLMPVISCKPIHRKVKS